MCLTNSPKRKQSSVNAIVAELKAVSTLHPDHEAQLLNYMRITRSPVGYLINFGPIAKVEWKRFVLSDFVGD